MDKIKINMEEFELKEANSNEKNIEKENFIKNEEERETEKDLEGGGIEWEELDQPLSSRMQGMHDTNRKMRSFLRGYYFVFKTVLVIVCLLLYLAYFVVALKHEYKDEGATLLMVATAFFVLYHLHSLYKTHASDKVTEAFEPLTTKFKKHSSTLNLIALVGIYIGVGVLVGYDVGWGNGSVYNLVSGTGLVVFVLLVFVFSSNPARIRWRTVLWGFALQLSFAVFILRWSLGYQILKWLGDKVTVFLDFSEVGCEFIFGPEFKHHFFAMKILPTIVFVSSAISISFYLGAMQWMILRISGFMESLMDTTAGESFTAAGNIFIGMIESPIMIKPLLPTMTDSEIHAVMTAGFATIAGACMAAYIGFGVPANHLISASFMSAPAALAISKIVCPETKKTKTSSKQVKRVLEARTDKNIVDAASSGASTAVHLIGLVFANLLAFISILAIVNSVLEWFGKRVGMNRKLSFQLICSYVLWPFAVVMGVPVKDCGRVAQLLGVKTFVNEFVAYMDLKVLLDNQHVLDSHMARNETWSWSGENILLHHANNTNSTLLQHGVIDERSMVISTYALCGFANFGSIGSTLGIFTALLPHRKTRLANLAVSAMLTGNIACLITASIAGLFYNPSG